MKCDIVQLLSPDKIERLLDVQALSGVPGNAADSPFQHVLPADYTVIQVNSELLFLYVKRDLILTLDK